MDVLNFLKFWRRAAMAASSRSEPRLGVEPDDGPEEDDSFIDLEFTVYTNEDSISRIDLQEKIWEGNEFEAGDDQVSRNLISSLAPNESISKRKILPIEPVSKPQSPIALLKSAPSFRILMFKKNKEMSPRKTEEMDDSPFCPSLSRSASTSRTHGRGRSERFSEDVLNKYLKLIKPLYVKISRRNGEKVKLSGDSSSASTTSSPSVASVSLKREKLGNIPAGFHGACRHLGKSKSASTITGIVSPARKSDDTLQLQYDGIQSAILHCKRSFNSREYASTIITQSEEKST